MDEWQEWQVYQGSAVAPEIGDRWRTAAASASHPRSRRRAWPPPRTRRAGRGARCRPCGLRRPGTAGWRSPCSRCSAPGSRRSARRGEPPRRPASTRLHSSSVLQKHNRQPGLPDWVRFPRPTWQPLLQPAACRVARLGQVPPSNLATLQAAALRSLTSSIDPSVLIDQRVDCGYEVLLPESILCPSIIMFSV